MSCISAVILSCTVLVRIGGFAFGMTLSLNTLLEKEDNLIGERAWSSAIKQSSLYVLSGICLVIFFISSSAISGDLLSAVISTRYILAFRKDNFNVFNS